LGWSLERRARQAEVIRASQPWKTSTGPRTGAGKARTAANALKHGFRSRPFIERVREERRLVRLAAQTIALAKHLLRATRGEIPLPPPPSGESLPPIYSGVPSTISCEAEGERRRPCLPDRPPP